MLECQEGSKTAGQIESHFYKVENSVCTCVFCGNTVEKGYFNLAMNQHTQIDLSESMVGQRG